jgi:hypothetical protein
VSRLLKDQTGEKLKHSSVLRIQEFPQNKAYWTFEPYKYEKEWTLGQALWYIFEKAINVHYAEYNDKLNS